MVSIKRETENRPNDQQDCEADLPEVDIQDRQHETPDEDEPDDGVKKDSLFTHSRIRSGAIPRALARESPEATGLGFVPAK